MRCGLVLAITPGDEGCLKEPKRWVKLELISVIKSCDICC